MTTITIKRQHNSIIQVECKGHTGYARNGEDIVCASVSSITQTAMLGLLNVAKVKLNSTKNDDQGYLKFEIIGDLDKEKRHECDMILETMVAGIKDLEDGFSKYVKLEEK